jgi:hypothetical protein
VDWLKKKSSEEALEACIQRCPVLEAPLIEDGLPSFYLDIAAGADVDRDDGLQSKTLELTSNKRIYTYT